MKISHLSIIFMLLLNACGPGSESGTISTCRATLDAMSTLIGGLEFPENFQTENPAKTGGEFDVMQYFSVLDHLSMKTGFVLDYVYHFDGMGGYPFVYARPVNQPPYATEADLPSGSNRTEYLDYIQTDDTPESYFQFVILSMMGSQFYLYWHANYSDSKIVCDKADVTSIVASLNGDFGYRISPTSRIKAALLQNLGPSIKYVEQTVEVRLVTFTLWGGFYEQTYTLNRMMPHTIQGVVEKNLVPYDCGVMF
jgi:hypothetical protein